MSFGTKNDDRIALFSEQSPVWEIPSSASSGKKQRVAAYCRVSTLSETQTSSLESQRLYFERKISCNPDWTLAGIYLESGLSGTSAESRRELQRLLSDCRAGRVDLILTKSISRFARNTSDCLQMVRALVASGVDLWFEKEALRTDTMGSEFLLTILAALAEEESRSISANIKWGINTRFRSGTYIQSVVPYGYRKFQDTLVVSPEEAAVVQSIFRSVLSGKGVSSIAHDLNNKNIPSPSGRKWGRTTLLNIIRNPVYIGDMVYQKTYVDEHYRQHRNLGELCQFVFPSHHDAIISREAFNLDLQNLRQRGREYGVFSAAENSENARRRRHRSVLSGKVFCARCGSVMRRSSSGRYPVFFCPGSSSSFCDNRNEMEDTIKNAFLTCLNKLSWSQRLSPDNRIIDVYIHSLQESECVRNAAHMEAIDRQISKLQKLQSSLIASPSARSYPERSAEITALEKHIAALLDEKYQLSKISDRQLLAAKLREFLSHWQIAADSSAFPNRLFSETVTRIEVHGHITVTFFFSCGLVLSESLKRDI